MNMELHTFLQESFPLCFKGGGHLGWKESGNQHGTVMPCRKVGDVVGLLSCVVEFCLGKRHPTQFLNT